MEPLLFGQFANLVSSKMKYGGKKLQAPHCPIQGPRLCGKMRSCWEHGAKSFTLSNCVQTHSKNQTNGTQVP